MDEKQLEAVIKLALNNREILFENRTFDFIGLWLPIKSTHLTQGLDYSPWSLMLDFQNLEFYRMAVRDESLPLDCWDMAGSKDVLFGRTHMIRALGDLKYKPACPELREAMLYDLNGQIRDIAAYSLGQMGEKKYVPDIIKALEKEPESYVRKRIFDALGNLKDSRASVPIRDKIEDLLFQIDLKEAAAEPKNVWHIFDYQDETLELRYALRAIFDIGGDLAEDTYKKVSKNLNPAVKHELKSAVFLSAYYEKIYGKRLITNPKQIKKEFKLALSQQSNGRD